MRALATYFVALAALMAQPLAAQSNAPWTRAAVPSGTAAVDLPCAQGEALIAQDEGTEIAACSWAGYEIVLLVMPEGQWDIQGVEDQPYDQTREQLSSDTATTYLVDTEMGGARAFLAEGASSDGKVGTAMVDLNAGRLLVLLVQSDGSPAAEGSLSQMFARVWGSMEVAPQ